MERHWGEKQKPTPNRIPSIDQLEIVKTRNNRLSFKVLLDNQPKQFTIITTICSTLNIKSTVFKYKLVGIDI